MTKYQISHYRSFISCMTLIPFFIAFILYLFYAKGKNSYDNCKFRNYKKTLKKFIFRALDDHDTDLAFLQDNLTIAFTELTQHFLDYHLIFMLNLNSVSDFILLFCDLHLNVIYRYIASVTAFREKKVLTLHFHVHSYH